MSEYRLVVVDLFCGAGGFSTGMVQAIVDSYRYKIADETGIDPGVVAHHHPDVQDWLGENILFIAVNHWDAAVETYRANHPWATVHNANVHTMHPPDAVTFDVDGELVTYRVDILIGGPSCVPWSKANGGMAKDDQLRMSPRRVADWLELLRPKQFLLENVEGLLKWGPPYREDGELKFKKDGSSFDDWTETLRNLGYSVDWDTFYASDYGDAQSRKRLFVMGRVNYEPEWPDPTHSSDGSGETDPYRPAIEIIDTSDPGMSIWTRDRDHPRVHNTLKYKTTRRIADGLRRHCDGRLEPFADALEGIGRVNPDRDDADPDEYADVTDLRENAVPAHRAADVAQERDDPFLAYGDVREGEDTEAKYGLCVPYILGQHGGSVARDATQDPCQSVTTDGAISLIEPETFILPRNGRQRDEFSNAPIDPTEEPIQTVTAHNHDGHVVRTEPFLLVYNGKSSTSAIDDPLPTAPATDRFALIVPEAFPWGLDLRYRLLKPKETARAQGFPEDYEFAATTKKDKTKLIGNAVPVNLAESMCRTLLDPTDATTLNKYTDGPQPLADVQGGEPADD